MAKKVYPIIGWVLGCYLLGTFFIFESMIFSNLVNKRMVLSSFFKISKKLLSALNELFKTRLILISSENPPFIP